MLKSVHTYQAFGMQIRSTLPLRLPELAEDSACDWPVAVGYGLVEHNPTLSLALGKVRYGRVQNGVQVEVPWAARFLLQGDGQITIDPATGSTEQSIALYVTGLVLPFLLRSRPLLTLHGSAVSGPWGALAFVGNQGSGKSTTAAALTTRGYRVLCDDMIPIAAGPKVFPGIALPKLLPDAYQNLIGDPGQAAHLFDGVDKFQVDLGGSVRPTNLRALFILQPGSSLRLLVEELKGGAKIRALLDHVATIDGIDDRTTQFARCTDRLGSIPVFLVQRPVDQSCLTDVVDEVCQIDTKRIPPC